MHSKSLIASLITVGIGLAVAAAASDGAEEAGGLPVFVWITLWAFAINWLVFVPSFLRQVHPAVTARHQVEGSAVVIGPVDCPAAAEMRVEIDACAQVEQPEYVTNDIHRLYYSPNVDD